MSDPDPIGTLTHDQVHQSLSKELITKINHKKRTPNIQITINNSNSKAA